MKFLEVLNQFNIEFKTEGSSHCRPGWINIDCPFCGKDSEKWHLGYNLEGKYFNCWQCGSHSIISTLIELTGLSFSKCKKLFNDLEIVFDRKEKIKGKLILPKGIDRLEAVHKRYLKERNFNFKKLIQLWKIQGLGIAAYLQWRIFIPIIHQGKTVSWTTRSIAHNHKIIRYITAKPEQESIHHKTLLYGEDYCTDTIIIHEGATDVWRTGCGAVATLGLGYSQAQVNRMVNYKTRVICFDNEKEAQKRAIKLCDDLSVYPGETFNVKLSGKDAASSPIKEIKELRRRFLK